MTAYLMVAYDLYVLRDNDKLQDDVVRRLRDRVQFEGARYQLYVAATFVRAGCAFTFDDESDGNTVADYYNRAVNEAPYEERRGRLSGRHVRHLRGDGTHCRRYQPTRRGHRSHQRLVRR